MAVGVITWSKTAASNSNADSSVNWAEGMAPSAVNDSARTTMASVAKWRDDLNATLIASGVSTGLTLTTNQVQGALTAGYEATYTTTFDIGTPATINVDALGPKPLRRGPAVEILASQIKAGQPIRMTYFTSNSGEWLISGTRGMSVVSQVFTSTSATTYTPTSGMTYCIVEAVGGGAAGGGTTGNVADPAAGGGGGGGSYSRRVLSATQITTSQIVTVGNGGAGTAGAAGANGGITSLGTLVTAPGGTGAAKAAVTTVNAGGAGGTTGTGDFAVAGGLGWPGNETGPGGAGGSSRFGQGGPLTYAVSAGTSGSGYGAGGAGAYNESGASNIAGGAGSPGIVIITEYL